jgi:hypothetical protein
MAAKGPPTRSATQLRMVARTTVFADAATMVVGGKGKAIDPDSAQQLAVKAWLWRAARGQDPRRCPGKGEPCRRLVHVELKCLRHELELELKVMLGIWHGCRLRALRSQCV